MYFATIVQSNKMYGYIQSIQISLKYSLIISSNCVHSGRKCYLQLINSYVIMKQHIYIYIETKREYYSDIYNILKDIEKL